MGPSAATTGHYSWKLEETIAKVQSLKKGLYEHREGIRTFNKERKLSTQVCHYDLAPKELCTNRSLYLIDEKTGIQKNQKETISSEI